MFLLFLCLGIANVNAQVRIGGNAAPNGAAVLDLNATDAATGTKGLALPRVRLDSATVQITPGVANLTGMLVYNTTATLGTGIYFWNGSNWVKANLPPTSVADSGKILMSNGLSWVGNQPGRYRGLLYSAGLKPVFDTMKLYLIADSFIIINKWILDSWVGIGITGITPADFCTTNASVDFTFRSQYNSVIMYPIRSGWGIPDSTIVRFRCYRASK